MQDEVILNMKIPSTMPRTYSRLSRWVGKTFFTLMGWQVKGELPNAKKMVVIAAPHTSNWDFVVAMLAIMAIGLRVSFLMKKEAFIWPFKRLFLWLGGVPVDRSQHTQLVDHTTAWFNEQESAWMGLAPEGTRKKVDAYKTGFIRIARAANVPVCFLCWDYPSKTLFLESCWALTRDDATEAQAIKQHIANKYRGRYPANQ